MRPAWAGTAGARTAGVLLGAVFAVPLGAGHAQAHTSLARTVPAAGATVVEPVDAVRLDFSRPVSSRQAQVLVTAPDGADLADGPVLTAGATVSQPLGRVAPAGSYLVSYRVLAQDGHPLTGQVAFVVAPAAAGRAGATGPAGQGPVPVSGSQEQAARAERPAGGPVPGVVTGLVALGAALLLGAVRSGRRARVGP